MSQIASRGPDDLGAVEVPAIPADADVLTAALLYADAGLYLGPVKSGTKHPGSVLGSKWTEKTSRDPKQITAWFTGTDHGVFWHCGRSGVLVFDIDNPDLVPDDLRQLSARAPFQSTRPSQEGRGHVITRMPAGKTIGNGNGRLGTGWGEVRGLNGVIIVAPSQHAGGPGCEYRWTAAGPIPELPAGIVAQLDAASESAAPITDAEFDAFFAEHSEAGTRPEALQGRVKGFEQSLESGGRHPMLRTFLHGALEEAAAGLYSATTAYATLADMFIEAVTAPGPGQRGRGAAEREVAEMASWCVGQVIANSSEESSAAVHDRVSAAMPTQADIDAVLTSSFPDNSTGGKQLPLPGVKAPAPTMKLWDALDLEDSKSIEWTRIGWLPSSAITVLTGDEGIGKSLLWVRIAAAITTGGAAPEFGIPARTPQRVVAIVTEDSWAAAVRPRLELAGADLSMMSLHYGGPDGAETPLYPRDLSSLMAGIDERAHQGPVGMVVVDAWIDTVEGSLSVKDPQQARQALHPWFQIATHYSTSVLLVTHTNRATDTGTRNRMGLTGVLRQKARVVLYAQQDEAGNLVVGPDKSNMTGRINAVVFTVSAHPVFEPTEGSDGVVPRLDVVGESNFTASEQLAESVRAERDSKKTGGGTQETEAGIAIGVALADGEEHESSGIVEDIMKMGHSARTIQRAATAIGVIKRQRGQGQCSSWQLPKSEADQDVSADSLSKSSGEHSGDAQSNGPPTVSDFALPSHPMSAKVAKLAKRQSKQPGVVPEKAACATCGESANFNPAFGDSHPKCPAPDADTERSEQ